MISKHQIDGHLNLLLVYKRYVNKIINCIFFEEIGKFTRLKSGSESIILASVS